jgi:hypothetical protein
MPEMDVALKDAMQIDGAIGAAVVDSASGMTLGTIGGNIDFEVAVAAAANTEVIRATLRTMEMLGMSSSIEDLLVTLSSQYHVMRPLTAKTGRGLFLYLALDKARSATAV